MIFRKYAKTEGVAYPGTGKNRRRGGYRPPRMGCLKYRRSRVECLDYVTDFLQSFDNRQGDATMWSSPALVDHRGIGHVVARAEPFVLFG